MNPIVNRLATSATVLAGIAALAGLLVPGLYVDPPDWVQQARGTDLATLFLAVPVLAVGQWAAGRGSAAGRAAVVAGLLYLVYNYAIFAFSVAMNSLTVIHIAIFGLALWSLLAGRSRSGGRDSRPRRAAQPPHRRRTPHRSRLAVRPPLARADRRHQPDWRPAAGSRQGGISANPVYALDLAFFLPLCALAGIGLLRRTDAADFAFPMLIWVPLMGAGVVGGFILMAVAGDLISLPVVVTITGLASPPRSWRLRRSSDRDPPVGSRGPPAIPSDAFWRRRSVVVRVGLGPTIAPRTIRRRDRALRRTGSVRSHLGRAHPGGPLAAPEGARSSSTGCPQLERARRRARFTPAFELSRASRPRAGQSLGRRPRNRRRRQHRHRRHGRRGRRTPWSACC